MSVSLERLARNQALFREVNERLLELSEGFHDGSMQFVCECSHEDCTLTVNMNHDEYESVREHATRFVVSPGHVKGPVETVVKRRRGYSVIEKLDRVVTRIVKRLNPRAENA